MPAAAAAAALALALAEAMQARLAENPTRAFLGQWYAPIARRKGVEGNLNSPVTVFWNVSKQASR